MGDLWAIDVWVFAKRIHYRQPFRKPTTTLTTGKRIYTIWRYAIITVNYNTFFDSPCRDRRIRRGWYVFGKRCSDF